MDELSRSFTRRTGHRASGRAGGVPAAGLRRRRGIARARRGPARSRTRRPAASCKAARCEALRRPSTSRPPNAPARMIGPYKLLEQIGEGGMGVGLSWPSRPSRSRRRVALKVIKPGMDTPAGDRPLRGRAAGAGADGPPQHRPGARRRRHRDRAGRTSSWSWSTACRSPSTATTTT